MRGGATLAVVAVSRHAPCRRRLHPRRHAVSLWSHFARRLRQSGRWRRQPSRWSGRRVHRAVSRHVRTVRAHVPAAVARFGPSPWSIAPHLPEPVGQSARRARQKPHLVRHLVDPLRPARFHAAPSRVDSQTIVACRQSPPPCRPAVYRLGSRRHPHVTRRGCAVRQHGSNRPSAAPARLSAALRRHLTRAPRSPPPSVRHALPHRRHIVPPHRPRAHVSRCADRGRLTLSPAPNRSVPCQ